MKKLLRATFLLSLFSASRAISATTGWDPVTAGTYDYNNPANWVGGTINGIFDSSLVFTGTQTITFNADTVLGTGLVFNYGGNTPAIRGTGADRTITLGGDISTTRSINLGSSSANEGLSIDLGGAVRTVTVATGTTLGFINPILNGGLSISGGTVNFSGANTYSGDTTVNRGVASFNGASGGSANSDITVDAPGNGNVSLTFNNASAVGGPGLIRAKSVTLDALGAGNFTTSLIVTGHTSVNSVDSITNALTNAGGSATVTITGGASSNARLAAGSFSRAAGSTTLFRGTNLGVDNIGTGTGRTNITFATAPTLVGGTGAGTTDRGIIVGTFGDIAANGTGLTGNGGLLTYDTAKGVRLLGSSEYKTSITDGQTQLDNIRLTNVSGGTVLTTNLTSDTTVNSISFNITGTGANGGVNISGDAGTRLTVNSGTIFATQLISAVTSATNSPIISVPILDLAGNEGHIVTATSGLSSQRGGGVFEISSRITNDGGNGITFGGSGVTKFTGAVANDYTGVTTVNSGVLYLAKTGGANAITGDIMINGGAVEDGSHQIADTANITINGGSFKLQIGNEGSSRSETFNNLTMNGGSYGTGSAGHSGVTNVLGNAVLAGGSVSVVILADFNVAGLTTMSGGTVSVGRSSTAAYNTMTAFNGGLNIVNSANGAYTPITIASGSSPTIVGGKVILGGDVTFTGNGTNTNTVTIASTTDAGPQGIVALNGARTFTIGDGAAALDLTVEAPIANDGATIGSLNKAGAGAMLVQGINTYTGATTVTAGRLQLGSAASIASTLIDIKQGGIYDTTSQSFAMTGGQTFKFTLDGTAGAAGLLDAGSLDITNGVVDFDSVGTLDDAFYIIASYTSLVGTSFASIGDLPSGYTLSYNYLGGNDIALVMIPEPSIGALMIAGFACLSAARRIRSPRLA